MAQLEEIDCDLAVIGGGMAGLPIANRAAYKGLNVVLIEKELLGGTCLNRGCIPTKTMRESARVAHLIRTADRFGIAKGEPEIDLGLIVDRKDRIVNQIRKGALKQVAKNERLTLIEGEAVFESSHILRAANHRIHADKIIINTGASPVLPPIEGLDGTGFYTNRTLLDERVLPERLIVIGGGFIGCEFAQIFSRLGSRVTILQRAGRLVPGEDPEISAVLEKVFRDEGIGIEVDVDIHRITKRDAGYAVEASVSGNVKELSGTHILVAAGRSPNTAGLGLNEIGVQLDARGFITVDHTLQTSLSHIWAIGDVTGNPMFTHSARDDADILYKRMFKNDNVSTDGRNVPYAIFTDPEISGVGLTEAEAIAGGFSIKIGKYPYAGIARAKALGETEGFIKLVVNSETDKILGAQLIGPAAGELIHEIVIAMDLGASYKQIAKTIHIHPTLSEGVNSAAGGVHHPS